MKEMKNLEQKINAIKSERKLRLLAVAFCRQIAYLITDPKCQFALNQAELFADKLITKEELRIAWKDADNYYYEIINSMPDSIHAAAASAVSNASFPYNTPSLTKFTASDVAAAKLEPQYQFYLLDYEFIEPNVITPTSPLVTTLAESIYQTKSFHDGLPVLADALEEIDANYLLVQHCRNKMPHYRGCWVLDLLTGRT
jgi:hypothetical protein